MIKCKVQIQSHSWINISHYTISLSCHEQVCLSELAHLNILVHDMINLLYYEYWTDKQKYLYV